MGISVICVNRIDTNDGFDFVTNHNATLNKDLCTFQIGLNGTEVLVGFNNQSFDDKLLKANGFTIPENIVNYDLLAEIWEGAGLGRTFIYPTPAGFGLGEKSGDGQMLLYYGKKVNIKKL